MKQQIIDLTTILQAKKVCIQEGLLWKYEKTPYSRIKLQDFDSENSSITFKLQEYSNKGALLNSDWKNARKIKLKYDKKSCLALHLVLPILGVGEIAVFELHPYLRESLQQLGMQEQDVKMIKVVEDRHRDIVDSNIFWIIEVLEVEEIIEYEKLPINKRIEHAKSLKQIATEFFKNQQYKEAIQQYEKIRPFVDQIPKILRETMTSEEKIFFQEELSKSFSNQCVCFALMNQWSQVSELSKKAIQIWDQNFKAHFFQARSFFERGQISEAQEQFKKIKVQFPNQDLSEVDNYIKLTQKNQKKLNEQKIYQQIIHNLSEPDQYQIDQQQKQDMDLVKKNRQQQKILERVENGEIIDGDDIQQLQ